MYVRSIAFITLIVLGGCCSHIEPPKTTTTLCIEALMIIEARENCLANATCAPMLTKWERRGDLIEAKIDVYDYCPEDKWPGHE